MLGDTMGPCPMPGSRRPEQTHTLFSLHTVSPTGRGLGPAGKVAWPGHVPSLSLWPPQSPLHSSQESLVPGTPHSHSPLPHCIPSFLEPHGTSTLPWLSSLALWTQLQSFAVSGCFPCDGSQTCQVWLQSLLRPLLGTSPLWTVTSCSNSFARHPAHTQLSHGLAQICSMTGWLGPQHALKRSLVRTESQEGQGWNPPHRGQSQG